MSPLDYIRLSLAEDIGSGDHSSLACIDEAQRGTMQLIVKQDGILAGVLIAHVILIVLDNTITVENFKKDGDYVKKGDVVFTVTGEVRHLLAAERTLLNYMQRMSGIATATHRYVKMVEGTHAKILDTRKTTPNMRFFEKSAVVIGGGQNHRFGLYDMIMLKDNHIDFAGGIEQAIDKTLDYLKREQLDLKIEIETRSIGDVERVLKHGGVHRIMLDNFTPAQIKEAVALINGQYETEASGGITDKNLREYAETGVDFISVGALTHHIQSIDMSLKFCENGSCEK